MAKAATTQTQTDVQQARTPREELITYLVDKRMSSKRFSPDEAFLKDMTRSAFEGEFTKRLAEQTDDTCKLVMSVLNL